MWRAWRASRLPWSEEHDFNSAENSDDFYKIAFDGQLPIYSDEKTKNLSKKIHIDALAETGGRITETSGIIAVKMTLDSATFTPPNKYSAECVRQKILNGEKCNNAEIDLFKTQLLCDIILTNNRGKIYVFVDVKSAPSVISELAVFLEKHKMYARIFLKVHPDHAPDSIVAACFSSPKNVLVTPYLNLPDDKSERIRFKRFLTALAAIYPIGAVKVIEK